MPARFRDDYDREPGLERPTRREAEAEEAAERRQAPVSGP